MNFVSFRINQKLKIRYNSKFCFIDFWKSFFLRKHPQIFLIGFEKGEMISEF